MAEKKNTGDEPVDFDDLLNLTADDEPSSESGAEMVPNETEMGITPGADAESIEDARIRELREALAAPLPDFSTKSDVPLTPKQREIQELEDQLAKRNAIIAESTPLQYVISGTGETILVHVVLDGFIALGEVWYRGQELEFEIGSPAHRQTFNSKGESWLDLAGDLQAQYDRWGKQYLAVGPFVGLRGEKFDDEVARSDARRGRAVPLIISR